MDEPDADTTANNKPERQESNTTKSRKLEKNGKAESPTRENGSQAKKNQVESFQVSDDKGLDEQDGLKEALERLPCYQRLHHSFCFQVCVLLIMMGLDAADLISDWLLYHDVSATEQGLVYGPPDQTIVYALLAFSIIGSMTFIFEIVNLWWEVFRHNPWIDIDLSSAITVWIEDVPQIIINVIIALCREEAISYFQLVKASVMIGGVIIRIVISLIKYCSKKALAELECATKNKESCRHVVYRVFIMFGLFVCLSGSISVFLFTQSERNPDGTINFKMPHTIVRGEYDDQKYFHNVSMFISHPLFDYNTADITAENVNWVRMATIDVIRRESADSLLKFEYDEATKTKIRISMTDANGTLRANECYTIDRTSKALTVASSCSTFFGGSSRISELKFKFHFQQPDLPGMIFGDITYNVKVKENGNCHDLNSGINDNIDSRLDNHNETSLHYYRIKDGISEENHVIMSGTTAAFYHRDNLTDITNVWKTGFGYCSSTGSLAPHKDTKLYVPCT